MERGVHHPDGRWLLVDGLFPDFGQIGLEHVFADPRQESVLCGLVQRRYGNLRIIGDGVDLFDHALRISGQDLAAGFVIDFVAVVLPGVVAGGDANARLAAQMLDRKRQDGCRHQGFEQSDLDPGGTQDRCRFGGKFAGTVAGVIGNGNLAGARHFAAQVVGQAQRRAAHRVGVHPVGPGAHHATQATGAKFQIAVKSILDLLGIGDGQKFSLSRRVKGQPLVVTFLDRHAYLPVLF